MIDPRSAWSSAGTNGKAVLFIHGFTGSPASMKPWAQYLAAAGYAVDIPLLPGHGRSAAELNSTRWQEWYLAAERAYEALSNQYEGVAICALSMGGSLALRLGALKRPTSIVLVNPSVRLKGVERIAIPLLSKFVPFFPAVGGDIKKPGQDEFAYDKTPLKAANSLLKLHAEIKRQINKVNEPLLVIHSRDDHVVPFTNSEWILANVGSSLREEVVLLNSYHVATLDNDAQLIFEKSLHFIEANWP